MAGQDATQAGRGVSRGLAGAVMIGCLALGMLLGTIGTINSAAPASGSNLRDADKLQKRTSEIPVAPHAADGVTHVLPVDNADVGSPLLPVEHADVGSPVKASEVHADAKDDMDELDPLFPTNAQMQKALGEVGGLDAEYSYSYDL